MYAGIHGAQRSGKTYFCVKTCIDFLKHTDRDIYTNLPVNPDYMARFAIGGRVRHLDKYYEVFRRIHIFMDFATLTSAKDFARKNRDFWRFCRFDRKHKKDFFEKYYSTENGNVDNRAGANYPSRKDWPREYYLDGYIWDTKYIFDFWRLTKRQRTVFMFDEFYEYFSALDSKKTSIEIRKSLLSFTRQHGHDNHHVYLISHKSDDLDKIIRDGFMYQYYIYNAKYKNLFKNKWLKGLRSPIQYFVVEGFASGDKEPQDTYPILPNSAIFKCYDSNSTGSTLKEINSGECAADKYDDNHGHAFIHGFVKYFKQQGWLTCIVILALTIGITVLYRNYKNLVPGKYVAKASGNISNSNNKKQVKNSDNEICVVGVFSNKVIWSDGFKLKKGDIYNGLKVDSINCKNESIVFSTHGGKLYSIPFKGCRTEQKTNKKSKRKS